MPLFNSQGIGTTVVVGLFAAVALAFAVVSYVEWSSDAAVAEFMTATSVSDTDHTNEASTPVQSDAGPSGCPVGKKKLPTQAVPLP
jgi:hypothetical protein